MGSCGGRGGMGRGVRKLNINATLISFQERNCILATGFGCLCSCTAPRTPPCPLVDRLCPLDSFSTKAVKRFDALRLLTWIYPSGFTKALNWDAKLSRAVSPFPPPPPRRVTLAYTPFLDSVFSFPSSRELVNWCYYCAHEV
jgi:hypothetical protein